MQTVQGTAMGVDPRTGRDRSGLTGGVVWGKEAADIERIDVVEQVVVGGQRL